MGPMIMEMYFYWSNKVVFLLSNWETTNSGQYFACLLASFLVAVFVEFLSSLKIKNDLVHMLIYATRLFFSYMLMLVLMTFNGGLFIAVMLGYTVGYFLTGFGDVKFETRKNPMIGSNTMF